MTSLVASVMASLVAYGVSAALEGHVSQGTGFLVSFIVWSAVFVPSFVWVKRLREGG
jgi:uncharacterized membrane protein YeiB